LRIALEVPTTARAGTVLDFLVTITNVSPSPLEFAECPVFRAWIVSNAPPVMTADLKRQKPGFPPIVSPSYPPLAADNKLGTLNCAPAHRLSAGASATFAIELIVRADAPLGASTLRFALAAEPWLLTGPPVEAPIEVIR
jgi:hypothetical protein